MPAMSQTAAWESEPSNRGVDTASLDGRPSRPHLHGIPGVHRPTGGTRDGLRRPAIADPVAAAQADLKIIRSIFGKWAADLLITLHAVPSIGFEDLRRCLPGISPRVLSLKLKELEHNGMVQREIPGHPTPSRTLFVDPTWLDGRLVGATGCSST